MLISRSKDREIRGGQAELIALVPELCRATGLTQEMKNDTRLMNDLGAYTKVKPDARITKLLEFNQRLKNTPLSNNVFTEWEMNLDTHLVELAGRELPQENIIFADGQR